MGHNRKGTRTMKTTFPQTTSETAALVSENQRLLACLQLACMYLDRDLEPEAIDSARRAAYLHDRSLIRQAIADCTPRR